MLRSKRSADCVVKLAVVNMYEPHCRECVIYMSV